MGAETAQTVYSLQKDQRKHSHKVSATNIPLMLEGGLSEWVGGHRTTCPSLLLLAPVLYERPFLLGGALRSDQSINPTTNRSSVLVR
jgi:hypothetical protein